MNRQAKKVLKVFRKRLNSTNQLLQDQEKNQEKKNLPEKSHPAKEKRRTTGLVVTSSDSDVEIQSVPDVKQPKSSPPLFSRVKKRKTRSELNRRRSKGNKTEDIKDRPCSNYKEKNEFQRHLNMAKKITQSHPVVAPTSTTITQGRLTRNVIGILNQGKRSKTIGRDTLLVPDQIEKETEVEMKKIFNSSIVPANVKQKLDNTSDNVSIPPNVHGSSRSAISLHSSPSMPQMDVDTVVTPNIVPSESPDSLPSSPDIPSIAESLLSGLNARKLFPKRDLLQETKLKLQKTLRENSMTLDLLARTPQEPSASTAVHVQQGTRSSETVTRESLQTQSVQQDVDRDHRHNFVPNIANSACIEPRPMFSHPANSDSPNGVTKLVLDAHTDGIAYLKLVERLNKSSQEQIDQEPCNGSHAPYESILPCSRNSAIGSDIQFGCVSSSLDDHQMEVDSDWTMKSCRRTNRKPLRVITQQVHPVEYLPGHHGDYYSAHRPRQDNFHTLLHTRTHPTARTVENMDILEYIDHSCVDHGSPERYQHLHPQIHDHNTRHRIIIPHETHYHSTDRHHPDASTYPKALASLELTAPHHMRASRLQLTGTQCDSDGSPSWYASLPPLPPKPGAVSPSPTLKLYPRRLY